MTPNDTEVRHLKAELHKRLLALNQAKRNYDSCLGMIAKAESDKHGERQERIKARRAELATRTPAEWLTRLAGIPDADTRIRATQIVWWDFFSNVTADKRTTAFDATLEKFRGMNETTDELARKVDMLSRNLAAAQTALSNVVSKQKKAVCHALSHAGYGADMARERMYGEQKDVD